MDNSSTPVGVRKPRPDFPLFPHASGRWAKKISGRLCYFGKTADDPNGEQALARFQATGGIPPAPKQRQPPAATADPPDGRPSRRRESRAAKKTPLWKHKSGRWAKWFRGKTYYFGKVADDPQGERALALWVEKREEILTGRQSRTARGDGYTVMDLANDFLTAKRKLLDSEEICQRTFDEYYGTCQRLLKVLGKRTAVVDLLPEDFSRLRANIAKTWGPVRLSNEITRVRGIFAFGFPDFYDRPVHFGKEFKKPAAKVLRKNRAEGPVRMFERHELQALLHVANPTLRAMVLLGINAGFGCTDCAILPRQAVDLARGWLSFPRPKTGVPRRVPLWPETVEAIHQVLADREGVPAIGDQLFLSPRGKSYGGKAASYRITGEMARTLAHATRDDADGKKVPIARPGLSFYSLRHTFQTVAEDSRDLAAVRAVMGHTNASGDMSAVYRERISEERLEAVVNVVHDWLYGKLPAAGQSNHRAETPAVSQPLKIVG